VDSLDALLKDSDIVSLHLPNNASTRKMFTAEKFAEMPEDSVFINCARGAIVDNDALADALNSGHLAGAGIDVFDMEPPLPESYKLIHAKNVVLTPHVGFLTEEAMQRRAAIEFQNVYAWLDGKPENVCEL
jgi:phosphoglycerate dehydrogenase-like enzyme